MTDNIKISVIVPAYNIEEWLARCLDSILAQTYSNLEIIVIDDGSTDKTGVIVDEYATRDPRIIPVHQENKGLVAVREHGITLATGEYVGFVDGDDAVTPDMYQRLLDNALKYDADISHCGVAFVFSKDHIENHYGTGKIILQNNFEGQRDLLQGIQIEPGLCNKLYRRELLKDSCLDQSVLNNEDLLRNFVLFQRAQKSVYEDFCGYQYYQRPGSMSKDKTKCVKVADHVLRARKLVVENCTEDVYPYAMQLMLSTYVGTINQYALNEIPEMRSVCVKYREELHRQRKNLHYLIPRQQVAARLSLYFPWLHKLVYKIYLRRR